MAIAIDTLAYARRLREAGFSESQAEGQAEALAAAMTDTLATKQDLIELRAHVDNGFLAAKRDVQELDIRMQAGFAASKEGMREMELRMDARFDAKLADLERRGLLTPETLASVAEVAKSLGLRIGEDVACGDRIAPLQRSSGPKARRGRRLDA